MPTATLSSPDLEKGVLPSEQELRKRLQSQYGDLSKHGWRVNLRWRFRYFSPEARYQAVVDRLVTKETSWIDVGGGKALFPDNEALSRTLAKRCRRLVGVDPSDNIHQNEFVHERVQSVIEAYRMDQTFDLATLRMVVEHIPQPDRLVTALARLVKPRGKVVLCTPNRWSLSSMIASMTPQRLHQWAAHFLWRAKEEDVFPTVYRMNTRRTLRTVFLNGGFREVAFAYSDDCSILQRFRLLYPLELSFWRLWRITGMRYPENNLLGVYERHGS